MPLKLIQGPPNSGRAGLVRRGLTAVLERDPVLVVPTFDDVDRFQRELCADGAVLGAEVTTFDGLIAMVATAGGVPPRPALTAAQRLGAVAAAISERRRDLRPLRDSAGQPGFPVALERLLEELQGGGARARRRGRGGGDPGGVGLPRRRLGPLFRIRRGPRPPRPR